MLTDKSRYSCERKKNKRTIIFRTFSLAFVKHLRKYQTNTMSLNAENSRAARYNFYIIR